MFAFEGLWMEELDPSTLSEQEEAPLCRVKHQLTLGNQSSSLQMGPNLPVLVLTSLQSSGPTWHL